MKTFISFALFALLLTGGYGQDTTTQAPTETTTEVTASTGPAETTTATITTTDVDTTTNVDTTASKDTTTAVPTTSPPVPTTTPKPVPTTSPKPVPTTTPKPTTTTPAASTTAKPPVAELGSWNVTDGNVTCIRADLKVRFMIPVNGREDYIALSPNATADKSSCNAFNGTQQLRLEDSDYVLTLTFEKDDKSAFLKNISLAYTLPGDVGNVYNDSGLFKVKLGNSYLCSNTETVPLANVSMEIFQIHLQSFGSSVNGDFGTAEECDADDKVNDIVPIAVGCALLALVVIVLIAYFVGRRRSRQKGYQSV